MVLKEDDVRSSDALCQASKHNMKVDPYDVENLGTEAQGQDQ